MSIPNEDEEQNIEDIISQADSFLENFSASEVSEPPNVPEIVTFEFASELDLQVTDSVTYIETYFWKTGELPAHTELGLPDEVIVDRINPKLKGRGLPEYVFSRIVSQFSGTGMDPKFVLACNIMCTVSGKSKAAKFKDLATVGVTEKTWNAWMNIPSYYKYAEDIINSQLDKVTDLDAKAALARNVANGDLQSIKYYHEFTGRFRPTDQNAINFSLLLGFLLEILVKNVSAETFDKIAGELENTPVGELMRGN
jgi:hypothetical protein